MITAEQLTDEQYTAAIEKIDLMLASPTAEHLMEMIELVRDEEVIHEGRAAEPDAYGTPYTCTQSCVGCLTERIVAGVVNAVITPGDTE